MNKWITDQEKPASKEEDQAAILIEAWAKARREAPPSLSPDCPPSVILYAFSRGGLGREHSRQMLLHLSSCGHCCQEEHRWRQEPVLGRGLNLQHLRRAAKNEQSQVGGLIEDVRGWLGAALKLSATLPGTREQLTVSGVLYPDEDRPPSPAAARLKSPAQVDRQGRLRLTVTPDQALPGFSLLLAVDDGRHRLELGTFEAGQGEVQVIADCAFLKLPEGELAPCFLSFAMMPQAMVSRWLRPSLLPRLQIILQETEEVVEVWDRVLASFTVTGEKWPEILRRELQQVEAPEADHAVLEGIKGKINTFIAVWQVSNGEEPPFAREIVARLNEVLQGTQTRRRKSGDIPPDATVVKKATKQDQKKGRDKVEVEK